MPELKKDVIKASGVLLHPTSLPSRFPCGTFGESSRTWLHLLAENHIRVWQVLPLSPVDGTGSPYSSPSCFALNPWFLDPIDLVKEGYISSSVLNEITSKPRDGDSRIDFSLADAQIDLLGKELSLSWLDQSSQRRRSFKNWCASQKWLENYVCFVELRRQNNNLPWWEWPEHFALRNPIALMLWKKKFNKVLLEHRLIQWHLDLQWQALRKLAEELGVLIFGDLPFYVAKDSCDAWSNRCLFSFLRGGNLESQSGVPPDYFSSDGQLWGTPIYRWPLHQLTRFRWWRNRIARQWNQFDLLRLDHFRALVAYWSVDGDQETAKSGSWKSSPGESLLRLLRKDFGGNLPLVAEDLGVITSDVDQLRDKFNLPGMKILQFAFNGDQANPYLPENIKGNKWVAYTGTHDNPTTLGWWKKLTDEEKERVIQRCKGSSDHSNWQLIEIGMSTEAGLFIAPLQDILCLDDWARFNKPGTTENNWCWRLNKFDDNLYSALKKYGEIILTTERVPKSKLHLINIFSSL